MAGNDNRRQKAAERKAAKRKEKKKALARAAGGSPPTSQRGLVRVAAHWPIHEALVSEGWNRTNQEPGIIQVVVARRAPSGQVGAAFFLIDLGCLGVKDAFGHVFSSEGEYAQRLGGMEEKTQTLLPVDLDLAAKIVREGVAYARRLGFAPHRDYFAVAPFLEGGHPEACAVEVPLGYQGKPFYVSGPYDNTKKIVDTLARTVGPGNFDYVARLPTSMNPLLAPLFEDDEDEDEPEEED